MELWLGVVAGRNQQISQDGQLVVGKLHLVLVPVVLVGPLEVLQTLLDCHLFEIRSEVP